MTIRNPSPAEEAAKANVRNELESNRLELLLLQPFIGVMLMGIDLIPVCDSRLKTACTDGERIFVDIKFYDTLERQFRSTVLAHELWHIVYLHFLRKQEREHEKFNRAADLEIHFLLASEKMPEFYVLPHDPNWRGLSAEEIYERLPADAPEARSQHVYPDTGLSDADGNEVVIDPELAPFLASDIGEKTRQRVVAAAEQIRRMHGELSGTVERLVAQYLHPRVCWQELLRQFISSCFGGRRHWLPPNRRYVWQGWYLQSRRDELLRCVVAIDTSGSTTEALPQFFAELASLMRSFGRYEMTVIQCDAAIQNVAEYDENSVIPPVWKSSGRGGTDFRPVFQYVGKMNREPALLIYVTDGHGRAPKDAPSYPVLWLLTQGGKMDFCDWGSKIKFKGKVRT